MLEPTLGPWGAPESTGRLWLHLLLDWGKSTQQEYSVEAWN